MLELCTVPNLKFHAFIYLEEIFAIYLSIKEIVANAQVIESFTLYFLSLSPDGR